LKLINIDQRIGVSKSMYPWGAGCWEEGMIAERKPPSFWPQSPDDDMRMVGALRSLEKENIELKELVVRLSETILRYVEGRR